MEPIVDFGVFELLAASGLAWIGRNIFARRVVAFAFLVCSLAIPVAIMFVVEDGIARWLAAVGLAASLINASVLLPLLRKGAFARLA